MKEFLSKSSGIAALCVAVACLALLALPLMNPNTPSITNNNYHVNHPDLAAFQPGQPLPGTIPAPLQPRPVEYAAQYHQHSIASPATIPAQRVVYVEQPRPAPAPDTTVVVVKPEIRQPEVRVVVIDEREERLKAEHAERMRQWTAPPVVVIR